jgi:two-component system cell cycle sensor histidine kinase/response regulator CckA
MADRSCIETVLVVEDEVVVRRLVRGILESRGYTVLEASRGSEALALCEGHRGPIHLMLTDVVMPQMSGPELADHWLSRRPQTKILYMSAYTNNAIRQNGILDVKREFLAKPFTAQALECKVREVLDGSSSPLAEVA